MATRQGPVAAFPFPALVCETGTRQGPVVGSALVAETVSTATPVVQPQVFVAT